MLLDTTSLGRQVQCHLQVSLPASVSCSVDVSKLPYIVSYKNKGRERNSK